MGTVKHPGWSKPGRRDPAATSLLMGKNLRKAETAFLHCLLLFGKRDSGKARGGVDVATGAFKLLVVLNASACLRAEVSAQRLKTKAQITLSERAPRCINSGSDVSIRYRTVSGQLMLDDRARLIVHDGGRSVL